LDNLTHTIAGLLLAEAAVRARARGGEPNATFRTAAYFASAFVNNAPDLDFAYANVTERPFGYLLHHRGHSHTIPVVLAIGLATAAVVGFVARRRRWAWSPSDHAAMFVLCLLGPLVHVSMDFSNNYGVHPFWPIHAGWSYGDAVFIVEPFFWAVGIPPLLFAARTRVMRFVAAIVLALGVGVCWAVAMAPASVRLVPSPMAVAVTLTAALSSFTAWRLGATARIAFGVVGCWAVAATFFAVSSTVNATIRRAPLVEAGTIHDVALTPFPANPLCSNALVVSTEAEDYVVRRATVATLPSLYPSDRCPVAADGDPTAPLSLIVEPATAEVSWKDEFRAPLRELTEQVRTNCQAAALARFLRVPYWIDEGDSIVLGDLRYDRQRGLDFADVRIEKHPARCPHAVPPWIPPRHDLLDSRMAR
jgi:inner membrane protein